MRVSKRRGRPKQVSELMSRSVLHGGPAQTLAQAASAMRSRRVGAIVVIAEGRLLGIITERDLLRAIAEQSHPADTAVSSYMTADPLTIDADENEITARRLMVERGIRHLPVTQAGQVVGMLSVRDVLAAMEGPARVGEPW